ncbi:similar to Saccharomyces cerevisiae YMR081C ISF1 Serine-rich, hydrophilic protein with similarity to Mbr1p [Maudiozyma saulgeensis]|uniref:Similar to Saccharomyces cerevisiae YMR081C ISF1 Serine-rich, hydrophilic protein with similarity to Mbr1p n=1 Tax=Maudiozyma saulgeensis TaxID=1789683 RepID=A0A1X7R0U3_9SACH|nr:similar to Saccharomyces cerevisiae YMR081C ISF1 Serine-rich, hydrophilic protein with similarity to Mbr1p [Kazachstania saulgeensis]
MANTSIRNGISCLNMFERAVQDPCSHGCDNEDDSGFSTMWRQNQSDPIHMNDVTDNHSDNELDELDPLHEVELSPENLQQTTTTEKNEDTNIDEPLIWTNPFNKGTDITKERQRQLLSRRRRSTTNNNGLSLRRTRTNSSCYIQQQSRRPLRSSMVEQSPGQQQRNVTSHRSFSNGLPITSTVDTPYSSLSATTSSGNISHDNCWVRPKTLSHSSCSSILTHLYGLEKYISSDLDALAFEDASSTTTDVSINNDLPRNNVIMQTDDNSHSDLNLNRISDTTDDLANVTKRQKSFIEQSLANSFS